MTKIKYFSLCLIVAIVLSFSLTTSKIFADWEYSEALSADINLNLNVIVLPWEGADELPNQSQYGNNHKILIENILSGTYVSGGTTQNIGLNTENSYLVSEINKRKNISYRDVEQLGSMDIWQSDRISEYFNLSSDSSNITFILEFPKDSKDTYYLYSTSLDLGDGWSLEIPQGTPIYPVYKTTLQKNSQGIWEAVSTEVGQANSAKYSNPYTGLAYGNAFDTSSWSPGKQGVNFGTAIYTQTKFNMPVELHNAQDEIYYYFKPSSNSNVTLNISDSDSAIAYVYNSNGELLNTRSNTSQGSNKISFSITKNKTYYVKITGDTHCKFIIS